jgi:oligosaccharide repeat unit polymerase
LLLVAATFTVGREFVGLEEACGSSVIVALSSWLVRKTTAPFNFRRITIMGFWYLTYLAMIFFPAFFVFANQEGPYRARFLVAVHTALITVPAGWLLASWLLRFRKSEAERFFAAHIAHTSNGKRLQRIFVFLLIPSLFLAVFYIRSVDTIPLFYLWRNPGDFWQVALLREDSFKLLSSYLLYPFYILRSVVFPFLVIVSLGFYLQTKTKFWRNLFFGTTAAAIFYSSLSAAKLPVAAIVALIGFLMYYYRRGLITRRVVAVLLIIMLVFPVGVIWIGYQGLNDLGDAFYAIGYRLFYLPSEVVYFYFEVFPNQHKYLYGRSIDKFARLMGWAPFDTPNYVGVYGYPGDLETISANGAFLANLNADFGMPGVLLGGVLTGFVMEWFHIYAVRRKKTVIAIALYSFLTYSFWVLHSSSLPIVLASNGVIMVTMISWWFDKPAISRDSRLVREKVQLT